MYSSALQRAHHTGLAIAEHHGHDVDVLLEPSRLSSFLSAEASAALSPAATVHARRCLELARHALFMQTSCGWFFDELTRIEPVLVLRHAARAVELAAALGLLALTGRPGRAADLLKALNPKAAFHGRAAFATTLDLLLCRRDVLPMDGSVYHRLDRVDAVRRLKIPCVAGP